MACCMPEPPAPSTVSLSMNCLLAPSGSWSSPPTVAWLLLAPLVPGVTTTVAWTEPPTGTLGQLQSTVNPEAVQLPPPVALAAPGLLRMFAR